MFTQTELDQLPTGLIVRHLPAKVQATRGGVDLKHYRWECRTAVAATADSTILGFAAFRWDGERWVPRNPAGSFFTPGDFAAWYQAPGGKIPAGGERADSANFCTQAELVAERTKWVFVAETPGGRRVKGEAIVEHLAELEPVAREPTDPVEKIRASAEKFRKSMLQYTGKALGYDQAGVEWLDGYIARNRAELKDNHAALSAGGAFFGECLREKWGGRWFGGDGAPWALQVDENLVVFPFTKLMKHLEDITGEAGDSLIGMFHAVGPMLAVDAHKIERFTYVDGKLIPAGTGPSVPAEEPPPGAAGWKFWRKK